MSELIQRIGLAFKCFFLVLFAGRLPDDIPEKYVRSGDASPKARTGNHAAKSSGAGASPVEPGGAGVSPVKPGGAVAPVLSEAQAARRVEGPAASRVEGPPVEQDRAIQLLALLQRDGRLVDFLSEDIAAYPDDQVGAAVREVHASCREVLNKYVKLEPVMPGEEGRPTVVEPGFDVASVKLVGTITGRPPFRGILRHKGWRARNVELPTVPAQAGRNIIAPAEVEIG